MDHRSTGAAPANDAAATPGAASPLPSTTGSFAGAIPIAPLDPAYFVPGRFRERRS